MKNRNQDSFRIALSHTGKCSNGNYLRLEVDVILFPVLCCLPTPYPHPVSIPYFYALLFVS